MWKIKKEAAERENCDTEWLPKCARSNDIKKKKRANTCVS